MIKALIGDKAFYKRLLTLMIPIMIQNGITNFVNMLDNIMIGAVGTPQMTGVAISNQLFFVFNLCVFGAVSGAGIFGAQFFGSNDEQGVRHTFRFKLLFCGLITVIGILLFTFCGEWLIELYMKGDEGITDRAATAEHALTYMRIMLIGLVPFTAVQCYSSTLREGGKPSLPMISGICAVIVNLVFNYLLIFGKFGFREMGVAGAAVATVISRFAEIAIVAAASHIQTKKYPFLKGLYKSFRIPRRLIRQLLAKGLPLMLNETLWASGLAVINQCYSQRGLDAVAACNISQTFWNIFSIAYMATGAAIGIILGQMLGSGDLKNAKSTAYKLIAFSFSVATVIAIVYAICAEFIPLAYNTDDQIRDLATSLMQITALVMPFEALTHASYFTMRSGGKMLVTFIFDNGFMWLVNVLLAYILSHFTAIPFLTIFAIIQAISVVKAALGIILVKNGFWIKNIISD